jgi:hypothetical protein
LVLTEQVAQMRLARSTPTPSLGKNNEGGWSRHEPSAIQSVSVSIRSICPPSTATRSRRPQSYLRSQFLFGSPFDL